MVFNIDDLLYVSDTLKVIYFSVLLNNFSDYKVIVEEDVCIDHLVAVDYGR